MVDQTVRVVSLADAPQGRISARILIEDKCQEIWFDAASVQLTQTANPFLAVTLLAAMSTNHPLVVDGPVSPRLPSERKTHSRDLSLLGWPISNRTCRG